MTRSGTRSTAIPRGKVVLFGATIGVEVYHHLLTWDSPWEVVGFTVNERFLPGPEFLGLPLVPFERLEDTFPPDSCRLGIPITYHHRANHLRAERFEEARQRGYQFIHHVCSKASTWDDLVVGGNSFVHEGVTIQPGVRIGEDVIVAPGALIGHHCTLMDHSFIGPGSAVLGTSSVGRYCVIGANATIRDGVRIGEAAIVGAGALITKDVPPGTVFVAPPAEQVPGTSDELAFLFGPVSGG